MKIRVKNAVNQVTVTNKKILLSNLIKPKQVKQKQKN